MMNNKEMMKAKKTVINALNSAYNAWMFKNVSVSPIEPSTETTEALINMQKTHKLVTDYIEAMLEEKDVIPMMNH